MIYIVLISVVDLLDRTICLEHVADTIIKTSSSTEKSELAVMCSLLLMKAELANPTK